MVWWFCCVAASLSSFVHMLKLTDLLFLRWMRGALVMVPVAVGVAGGVMAFLEEEEDLEEEAKNSVAHLLQKIMYQ